VRYNPFFGGEKLAGFSGFQFGCTTTITNPPHFDAFYAGHEVEVGIDPVDVLEGGLSRRAIGMVLEWVAAHQQELKENWRFLNAEQLPNRIEPLH
jgi:hypothetical protein